MFLVWFIHIILHSHQIFTMMNILISFTTNLAFEEDFYILILKMLTKSGFSIISIDSNVYDLRLM